MTKSERTRSQAELKAKAYFDLIPKSRRGLPMPLKLPLSMPRARRRLSAIEWVLYRLHRGHHLKAHPDYDQGWRRPTPEAAESLVRALALPLNTYIVQHGWLLPDERHALKMTAAQAAVAVLAAGIAVGRGPSYVWNSEEETLQPVLLTRNRILAVIADGWSDRFRELRTALEVDRLRVTDLRRVTLRWCWRDLARNGLDFEALWGLAKENPLYSTTRLGTGGFRVEFKDVSRVEDFARALADSGFQLHEYGRRLMLAPAGIRPNENAPVRQEIAGNQPYNVVQLGSRSFEIIRTLEQARLQFHVSRFRHDIRSFRAEATNQAKEFQDAFGGDPYHLLTQSAAGRAEFFGPRPEARQAWASFRTVAIPVEQWGSVDGQVMGWPDVVLIRSMFERATNRRWEATHLWPGDVPETLRGRWFSASDGSPLAGFDVSASQTQILAVFLGLRELEVSTRTDFNDGLVELVWERCRDCLAAGYEDKHDPRLRELVKAVWMLPLYGKPAEYVAIDQHNEPGDYGPGWAGGTDEERGESAERFLTQIPAYRQVSRFVAMCREVASVALAHDEHAGVRLTDPFDAAQVRWNPVRREKKVERGILLRLPAHQEVFYVGGTRAPANVTFPPPNRNGDYPVDPEKLARMVAPCLVHTLDAFFAGLVIEGLARAGVRDLVSIHDCWLVPEAHTNTLARCIKDAGRPWLQGLGGIYATLIDYLTGTKYETEARRIQAVWEARVADNDWPVFTVKRAEVNSS